MQLITGKQLFDSFTGIDRSLTSLKQTLSGKLHVTAQYKASHFNEAGDLKDIASKFSKWAKTLERAERKGRK